LSRKKDQVTQEAELRKAQDKIAKEKADADYS
jgi:hypothetical protein